MTVLVTEARIGLGAVLVEGFKRLEIAYQHPPDLPVGPLARQAQEWLALLEDVRPTALVVNHLEVRQGGASRHSVEAGESLLAAAARCATLERVVVVSSGQIYGAADAFPTFVTESFPPAPSPGPTAEALAAVEASAVEFAKGRPDAVVTILRPTEMLSPAPHGLLADHLLSSGRWLGVDMGFDPQVQFVTDHDVAAAVVHGLMHEVPGIFNYAPPDAVPLSMAARVARKARLSATRVATQLAAAVGNVEPWTRELAQLLRYGRALDPRQAVAAGFPPAARTVDALAGAFAPPSA